MRRFKRIAMVLSLLLLMAGGLAGWAWWMVRSVPNDYERAGIRHATTQQRETLARQAEDKLVLLQNFAAEAAAWKTKQSRGVVAERPTLQLDLHEQEINASFSKWSKQLGFDQAIASFATDPRVIVHPQGVVLAAKSAQFNGILSAEFATRLEDNGRLDIRLSDANVGRLPIPKSLVEKAAKRAESYIQSEIKSYRLRSQVDHQGLTSGSAAAIGYGELLLSVIQANPIPAIVYLPIASRNKAVPVAIRAMILEEGALHVRLEPLDAWEETALRERLEPAALAKP